jgi:dolichol kinase
LFHATAGSSLAVFVLVAPEGLILPVVAALAVAAVALEIVRRRAAQLNRMFVRWLAPLLKGDEDRRITGSTYMVVAALAVLLLFDRKAAALALVFLALGDPAAALVGQRMPGLRLWGKSPWGTLAFLVVDLMVVAVWVWSGDLRYHWGLLAGVAAAALVELIPLPMDDNLSIPLAAGAVMQFTGAG